MMIDTNTQCGACVGGGKVRRLRKKKYTNGKHTNGKHTKGKHTKKYRHHRNMRKTGKKWRGLGGSVMFQPYPPTNLQITPDFLKI